MGNISDIIEHHLKKLIRASSEGVIEIKRSELAQAFQCVPSQINYVISTRFTLEQGYWVESKRGGGGYIRIQKISIQSEKAYFQDLLDHIGVSLPQVTAEHIIYRLVEDKRLTLKEARLMKRLIMRDTLQIPLPLRDQLRARMMRVMVTTIFTDKGE